MSDKDVQFDIDGSPRPQLQQKNSVMVRLVIRYSWGLIKDEAQANFVLLGLAAAAFAVSLVLFFR